MYRYPVAHGDETIEKYTNGERDKEIVWRSLLPDNLYYNRKVIGATTYGKVAESVYLHLCYSGYRLLGYFYINVCMTRNWLH